MAVLAIRKMHIRFTFVYQFLVFFLNSILYLCVNAKYKIVTIIWLRKQI